MTADDIIRTLDLEPHPEGGWFCEVYRAPAEAGGRGASTAIYFLLRRGERSHWHRVRDADEVWHHYAGAPLRLSVKRPDTPTIHRMLGPDLLAGHRPQAIVPADAWQAAESIGDWTLCGCTVAPAFRYEGFELAPPDWSPDR